MPWQMIVTGGALVLFLAAWLFRRRQPSSLGPMPDVDQPSETAEPMVEPRLQDIGFASYELPLPAPDTEPDRHPG